MIGSLLYLITIHPDTTFSVGVCSHYKSKPKFSHLTQVTIIIKYINGTNDYGILYSHNTNNILVGYCDAGWAGNAEDRKRTFGGQFFLGNDLISWFNKKKNCMSLCTAKAEYIATCNNCTQLLWIKQMLKECQTRCYDIIL
ncbi:secreted RxLR effector protein 161-like [Lathyrus oleraceus]|uniref:secreted RxLR effector protein 161-like n=1 Tax=Pisum sativum TaxID=3888 RepID=UPI0021D1ECDC|nr:secreted RxLR effector protein 161-like [Pisum sativum]